MKIESSKNFLIQAIRHLPETHELAVVRQKLVHALNEMQDVAARKVIKKNERTLLDKWQEDLRKGALNIAQARLSKDATQRILAELDRMDQAEKTRLERLKRSKEEDLEMLLD